MADTSKKICLLPGDGIGPEIVAEAVRVLDVLAAHFDLSFEYETGLIGGAAIDEKGTALPTETLQCAREADAVLLGAVGGPKWDTTDPDKPRPEQGLLEIRKELGLYANVRPVQLFDALVDASSLKPSVVRDVDLVIVRELTGGLYFGARGREFEKPGSGTEGSVGQYAFDTLEYNEYEIERIARFAFDMARKRRGRLHSIDKANVLESSRLWRAVVHRVSKEYPEVELIDQLVDNTAMQLINNPTQFDVVVTENMFGDILSDEASMLTGSLGMLASASLGDSGALYEPSHGSAPDIAGLGIANPLAQILSVEMMLRLSFGFEEAAQTLHCAVDTVLNEGYRTKDIAGDAFAEKIVGTEAMGDMICEALTHADSHFRESI